MRRSSAAILFLILACCASSLPAKLPSDKFLPLNRDFQLKRLDHLRKSDFAAYRKTGHHDPRWDDDALRFVEQAERLAGNIPADPAPSESDLRKLGQRIIDAGCDDPLVLYCLGRLLQQAADNRGVAMIQRAATEFERRPYSPHWAVAALHRSIVARPDDDNNVQRWVDRLATTAIPTLLADPWLAKNRDIAVSALADAMAGLPPAHTKRIRDVVEKTRDVDPVIVKVVIGLHHAGHARGLPAEKSFTENLNQASEALTAAWELDPNLPEVCREMIRVASELGDSDASRRWLDRAIVARFDFLDAYDAYIDSIDGASEEMMAFAVECAQTNRFDTDVPAVAFKILGKILDATDGDFDLHRDPDNFAALHAALEGYLPLRTGERRNWCRSALVALAARCGQWDVAAKHFDPPDLPLDPYATALALFAPDELAARVHAHTGPARDLAAQAAAAYARQDLAEAHRLYALAANVEQPHAAAKQFFKSAARAVGWQQDFESGKLVDITPDANLTGWQHQFGQFANKDGWTACLTPTDKSRLMCMADFGTLWTIDVEVESDPADGSAWGVLGLQNGGFHTFGVSIAPAAQQVRVHPGGQPVKFDRKPARNTLTVRRHVNVITVSINGQRVINNFPEEEMLGEAVERVALGVFDGEHHPKLRFGKVTIRNR